VIRLHHLSYWNIGIEPVDPRIKRLWLLGDKKLKGEKLNPVFPGMSITERINITTFIEMRMVTSWSESPILRVNMLFFRGEDGFFRPQKGQLSMEPDISFLQFGQSSDVRICEEAIFRLVVKSCQANTLATSMIL
jgi:hypothetical protein